jgi:type III restriction enzyme
MFADLNTTYMERVDVIGNTAFLKFVERLLQADNAATLKAWVKAPDVGFFPIEYGFQPGGNGRSKRGQFNPDFFLLRGDADEVIVDETKADDDVSDGNAGKCAYATDYFTRLNALLKVERSKRPHQFHFLSPVDYDDFFAGLRDGTSATFVSTLQVALSA